MNNLEKFIADNNITIESSRVASSPFMDNDMFHYQTILRKDDKTLVSIFSMGCGCLQLKKKEGMLFFGGVTYNDKKKIREGIRNWHFDFNRNEFVKWGRTSQFESNLAATILEPRPPTAFDVLYSLITDASVINYDCFDDWCSDFGYSDDSIKAKKIYEACIEGYLKLRSFIGRESLTKLQNMDLEEEAE